ncbi:hypothetical protein SBADM41S_01792 [Streptomyces badius]
MDIDPVPFNTPQPHRGHGAVVFVAAIRPEPEADRKVLSCRATQHDRMFSNFEAGPPPYSRHGRLRPFKELAAFKAGPSAD